MGRMAQEIVGRRQFPDETQRGFSLIEVMIALMLFAMYILVIMMTHMNNLDKSRSRELDLMLLNLANVKMQEVKLAKNNFNNVTENETQSGKFEDFEDYEFKVQIRKIEFPNFAEIAGMDEEEGDADSEEKKNPVTGIIFDKLKKNLEEMIWQVEVTVWKTNLKYEITLSSWVSKENPIINKDFGI